jgi:cell division protein FtsI/penicillin-binding protein 2
VVSAAAFYLTMGKIKQNGGGTAVARFTASVDLGQDGAPWVYGGIFSLRQVGQDWKIVWSPTVINPGLRPGLRLAMVSTTRRRQPVLDAEGRPLQTRSTAFVVGVYPGKLKSAAETAGALGRLTQVEPSEVLGWIQAAPRGPFLELITFPPVQFRPLAGQLRKIPGLVILRRQVRLFTSKAPDIVGSVGAEASMALRNQGIAYRPGATVGLSGIQSRYQSYLAGTPTTEVVAQKQNGDTVRVLKTWPGRTPAPVRTTIDAGDQQAASGALRSAPGSAAIVAMQSSTGRILAVANRRAARLPAIDPLNGHYPPGGAFSIISAEALLAKGLQMNSPGPCYSVSAVGGHNFRNVPPNPGPGVNATFAADFARFCGTAFSFLSQKLSATDLSNAAAGFGFARQWQLPLKSFSGTVGTSGSVADLAAATIGQGNVKVSPLTMADVAAEVATGTWHEPSLVTRPPDAQRSRRISFSVTSMNSLRALMREAVHSGAARRADLGGQPVYGQVGTTMLKPGRHPTWATWFVGYRGDLAFAVLEFSRSPRISALPVAASFLRAAPAR